MKDAAGTAASEAPDKEPESIRKQVSFVLSEATVPMRVRPRCGLPRASAELAQTETLMARRQHLNVR